MAGVGSEVGVTADKGAGCATLAGADFWKRAHPDRPAIETVIANTHLKTHRAAICNGTVTIAAQREEDGSHMSFRRTAASVIPSCRDSAPPLSGPGANQVHCLRAWW